MKRFDEYGFPAIYPPEILNQMCSHLRISPEKFRQLHLCFDAANNLYATISLRELYGLCSSYLPMLTAEDFLAAAEVIAHEGGKHYAIIPREIYSQNTSSEDPMDQELVAEHLYAFDDKYYYDLVERQKHKPLYTPEWTEFSKYADQFYIEPTHQQQVLTRYLQNTQRNLHCPPAEIVDELYCQFRGGYDLQDTIDEGQRLGIRFQNQQEFRKFLVLLLKLSHHTRCYAHRGHTPAELGLPTQTLEDVLKNVSYDNNYIDSLDKFGELLHAKYYSSTAASVKPSRRAPCPCGSGKKYKNCCGK